jgi:hypothetical protein
VVQFLAGAGVLGLLQNMQTNSWAHPASYLDISLRLKEMGSETEHPPPSRAELMHGSMPPFPHYLHNMGRDNFTITFLEERGRMASDGVWQMKRGG